MGEPRDNVREERAACPLYTALGVIEGRWKPMLFQRLARSPSGFGELHRAMPGISRKVLAEQLRQMEDDDLLVRHETGDSLGSVRYQLTPHGLSLMPVFNELWKWGNGHLAREGAERGTRVSPPESLPSEAH
jgi:DNA-binding HxlR family transcriptional regulator